MNLLDNAASEHSDNAALLCEYGSLYLAVEEPDRANRYFERARSISENNTAIIGLAAVDILRHDYDRAVPALNDWLRRKQDDGAGNALLARALLESHKENEAAEAAERALALDPYNVEALLVLAYVKSILGKPDESRGLAGRIVSLDPFNFAARPCIVSVPRWTKRI
jgi:tetratricopeptide (TPR) repeat protein